MDSNLSVADIAAVTKDRDGFLGDGGGGWFLIIILLFLFGGGYGWGNRGAGNIEDFATQREVLNSASQTQRDVLTSSCNTQKEILDSRYTTQLGFQNLGAQMAQCCCDIKTAIATDGLATRQLIQENTIQELRDRLNNANNALTVQTITNNVVSQLQPTPKPAYLTCSPYASAVYPYNYYGVGYGCSPCSCSGTTI